MTVSGSLFGSVSFAVAGSTTPACPAAYVTGNRSSAAVGAAFSTLTDTTAVAVSPLVSLTV